MTMCGGGVMSPVLCYPLDQQSYRRIEVIKNKKPPIKFLGGLDLGHKTDPLVGI